MTDLDYLVDSSGNFHAYYCRGHVDPAEFCAAVAKVFGDEPLDPGQVKHVHLRKTPAKSQSYFDIHVRECEPGRGAFPATITYP